MEAKNYTSIFMVLLITLSLKMHAQNVTIPDANFKNALVELGVDTNEDNEIQVNEAADYTGVAGSMSLSNRNISDITGIEAFVNITELYCNNNNITSLDISGNTSLLNLFCYNNQLTTLNVSNNPNLEILQFYNNQLSAIDVSNNTVLYDLNGNDNLLTSVDFTNNTALTNLNLSNNQLTSVDLSNNSILSGISIAGNALTSLDFSSITTLTVVDCSNNNLSALNVANGNTAALNIFFAQGNLNLSCIQIDEGVSPGFLWMKDDTAEYSIDCESLSVDYVDSNRVKIYPNPVSDVLQISSHTGFDMVRIYDTTGKEVLTSDYAKTVDVSHLIKGIYFIKVFTNGSTYYQKIIKK